MDEGENKEKVVSNKFLYTLIAISFISPFVFSISFITITIAITKNSSPVARRIGIILSAIFGIIASIILIFFFHKFINKKYGKVHREAK